MTGRIALFGATGYTGALALEAFLARGLAPTVVGRNGPAIADLAERHGLEHAVADVTDPASVRRVAQRHDVLISTVGPFERHGDPIARAAADAGAHYLDTTGEVRFVHTLKHRYHDRAQETGAVMLPAFGYDYIPGILAGTLAARQGGDRVRNLDIGYFATGPLWRGLSHGTRTTMRDGLTLPSLLWHQHRLVNERTASSVRTFAIGHRRKAAFLVSGSEVLFLPETFPELGSVRVYNGWFPTLSWGLPAVSAIANSAARHAWGRRLIDTLTHPLLGPPGGPDAHERAKTRTHVVAVASDGPSNTPLAEVHLTGPSIYTLTAELIAWAAHQLATRTDLTPGATGPVQAFGLDTLRQGGTEIGLTLA